MSKAVGLISISPGEMIQQMMECFGWNQTDLAEITGLSGKTVSLLVQDKQNISLDIATLLGETFEKTPEFWINMFNNYKLKTRDEKAVSKEKLTKEKAIMHKYMPVAEMKKKGWFINDVSTIDGIKKEYERLFSQSTFPVVQYKKAVVNMAARQTKDDTEYTPYYRKTWFTFAQLESKKIENPCSYDSKKLGKIAKKLYSYTIMLDGEKQVLQDLNRAGVNFFVLSHLSKTYLDGAAFINDELPFIVYTGRYDRVDNFWFVLAHEIAHILHHYSYLSNPILDDLDGVAKDEIENEADEFAGVYLRQQDVINSGRRYGGYITEERLNGLSEKTGVSVPVALGMLQHAGIVQWRQFARFREKVMDKIPSEYIKG
jgi:HTH-type transcriptional regulator/antitoxin HigA